MSAPIYTKRFGALVAPATGAYRTIGTCPAGKVWVLRDLRAYNQDSSGLLAAAVNGTYIFEFWTTTAANQTYSFTGRLVIEAGETLDVVVTSSHWTVVATGYELTA